MTFRSKKEYVELLGEFNDAVKSIRPYNYSVITRTPQDLKKLEKLIVVSYQLMKYIRTFLTKKKLDYTEGTKFPDIYTALDEAMQATKNNAYSLAIESSKLEAVSRSAYAWIKNKTAIIISSPQINPRSKLQPRYCVMCKVEPATDDSGFLCDYCSGKDNDLGNQHPYPKSKKSDPFYEAGDMMFLNRNR